MCSLSTTAAQLVPVMQSNLLRRKLSFTLVVLFGQPKLHDAASAGSTCLKQLRSVVLDCRVLFVQVLFSVMQNYRPEIPADEELPGKPGATLPRCVHL